MSTTEHQAYTEEQSKAIFEELLAGLEDLKQRGLLEHVRPKVMELLEAIEGQEHHLADADKKTDPDHIVGATELVEEDAVTLATEDPIERAERLGPLLGSQETRCAVERFRQMIHEWWVEEAESSRCYVAAQVLDIVDQVHRADKDLVKDLLSRLPLADQMELLRGVLPEVSRHHFPESDYEREFVEFDLNSQVIQVVKPWNDVDPDLGQPSDREDLLSVAAVCLAAAAELGGCDE